MITKLQELGDLMVRKVTPPIVAEATAAACHNEYCCCVPCGQFFQDTIRYDRICNGVYQYTWSVGCGSCAD